MATPPTPKKVRHLRAPETVRERASKSQLPKRSRLALLGYIAKPFQIVGSDIRGLKIWRPFAVAGRFLGQILIPPYIRRSFGELSQVTWPDRLQTFRLTSAVLIFAVVFGTIVAIVDFGLDKLFKQVLLR